MKINLGDPNQLAQLCIGRQKATAVVREEIEKPDSLATDRALLIAILENQEIILLALSSNLIARAQMQQTTIQIPRLAPAGRG